MQVRVITMRYQEGLQGFPEDALRAATFGKTVLDVRECPHSDATRRGRRVYFAHLADKSRGSTSFPIAFTSRLPTPLTS